MVALRRTALLVSIVLLWQAVTAKPPEKIHVQRAIEEVQLPQPRKLTVSGDEINAVVINDKDFYVRRAAVLLLHAGHGENTSSLQTWVHIKTLHTLHLHGVRAVAVDLPGYGNSSGTKGSKGTAGSHAGWLAALIEEVEMVFKQLQRLILVSPSISGIYAIPYIKRYGAQSHMVGWMAPSPVQLRHDWDPPQMALEKIEVVAFYGEKDSRLKDADRLTSLFTNSHKVVIPKARRASYMDAPAEFNRELLALVRQTAMRPQTAAGLRSQSFASPGSSSKAADGAYLRYKSLKEAMLRKRKSTGSTLNNPQHLPD